MSGNMSFTPGSSPTRDASSDDGLKLNEGDLWMSRIILSALEDVAFSNTSKIPPDIIQALQTVVLNIKSELPPTPFLNIPVEEEYDDDDKDNGNLPPLATSFSTSLIGQGGVVAASALLKKIPVEKRLVLRSLVASQIKNVAKSIAKIYKPLLKLKPRKGAEEETIREELAAVNKLLEDLTTQDKVLGEEVKLMQKGKEGEILDYEKDVMDFETVLAQLMENAVQENLDDKTELYIHNLRLENENLMLKLEIEQLKQEIESNPPELTEKMEELYLKLLKSVDELEVSVKEKEKAISDYQSLGQTYTNLLEEYGQQEDQIKTKEWVKEQLQLANANMEKSLNESFF